jgi:hypothetical protein
MSDLHHQKKIGAPFSMADSAVTRLPYKRYLRAQIKAGASRQSIEVYYQRVGGMTKAQLEIETTQLNSSIGEANKQDRLELINGIQSSRQTTQPTTNCPEQIISPALKKKIMRRIQRNFACEADAGEFKCELVIW